MKHLLTIYLLLYCCCPVVAQTPAVTKLDDLKLALDRLEIPAEHQYAYQSENPGSKQLAGIGTLTLRTSFEEGMLVLRDSMKLTYRGDDMTLEMRHRCRKDNYLSPVRIESAGEGSDEVATFVAIIENEKATITGLPRQTEIKLPNKTLTFSALQRIVTLLPREKGTRVAVPHLLESDELHLKHDFLIQSLGQDEIGRGDQRIACTKFHVTSPQIMPLDLWVDSDGILQRMIIDRRKFPPVKK